MERNSLISRYEGVWIVRRAHEKERNILAALLTATPTLAAEQCQKTDPIRVKYADTAHCFLRIDGKVIINRTCHYSISGDTRVWVMGSVAAAWMEAQTPGRPVYGYFCRAKKCSTWPNNEGPGPGRGLVNYGPIDLVNDPPESCPQWSIDHRSLRGSEL